MTADGDRKARGHQRWMGFYAAVTFSLALYDGGQHATALATFSIIFLTGAGVIQAMRDFHKEPRP